MARHEPFHRAFQKKSVEKQTWSPAAPNIVQGAGREGKKHPGEAFIARPKPAADVKRVKAPIEREEVRESAAMQCYVRSLEIIDLAESAAPAKARRDSQIRNPEYDWRRHFQKRAEPQAKPTVCLEHARPVRAGEFRNFRKRYTV